MWNNVFIFLKNSIWTLYLVLQYVVMKWLSLCIIEYAFRFEY